MAWAFDTKGVIADDAGSGTVNFTCGVTAKLLVVAIATTTTTTRTADGADPTYGGTALTNTVTETDAGGEGTAELWYMIDPPTGQALPVVVTGTPNKTTMISSYTCAAGKTAALRTSNHAHTSGTNATVTLANTAGDLCVDSLFSGYTTPGTEAHTLLYEYDTGSESCAAQYKLSGGTNQVMNYTTSDDDYYIVAAAFYEADRDARHHGPRSRRDGRGHGARMWSSQAPAWAT